MGLNIRSRKPARSHIHTRRHMTKRQSFAAWLKKEALEISSALATGAHAAHRDATEIAGARRGCIRRKRRRYSTTTTEFRNRLQRCAIGAGVIKFRGGFLPLSRRSVPQLSFTGFGSASARSYF